MGNRSSQNARSAGDQSSPIHDGVDRRPASTEPAIAHPPRRDNTDPNLLEEGASSSASTVVPDDLASAVNPERAANDPFLVPSPGPEAGAETTRIKGQKNRCQKILDNRGFKRPSNVAVAAFTVLDNEFRQRVNEEQRLTGPYRRDVLRLHIAVGEQLVLLTGSRKGLSAMQIALTEPQYAAQLIGGRPLTCPSKVAIRHWLRETYGRFTVQATVEAA